VRAQGRIGCARAWSIALAECVARDGDWARFDAAIAEVSDPSARDAAEALRCAEQCAALVADQPERAAAVQAIVARWQSRAMKPLDTPDDSDTILRLSGPRSR
jgi:hypothetical protein